MDATFLQARIDAAKLLVEKYETAIDALLTGGIQEYTLDTGQSRTKVTRLDLPKLEDALERLENRIAGLENRRNGSGALIAGPAW